MKTPFLRHVLRWAFPVCFLVVAGQPASALTLSGRVTGPNDQPVEGVAVIAVSHGHDPAETQTTANGSYSLEIQAGTVSISIVPEVSTRLVPRAKYLGLLEESTVFDVRLAAGNLVSGTVRMTDGRPPSSAHTLSVLPMRVPLPADEWLPLEADTAGVFSGIVPADQVWLEVINARPLYSDHVSVDMRSGDVGSVVVTLSHRRVHPIPSEPPIASEISFGEIDDLGEAVVTGSAGAVLPGARVLLVNLASAHQASAVAEADGSFSASIFAPPGSPILVKHGPPGWRWSDLDVGIAEGVNPFPGTIIQRPFLGSPPHFDDVGAAFVTMDDLPDTQNTVGTAWWVSGELRPQDSDVFVPGGGFTMTGELHVFSPAIDGSTVIDEIAVGGWAGLVLLVDESGRVRESMSQFMSTDMTPTGFPIQTDRRAQVGSPVEVTAGEFTRFGDHELIAPLSVDGDIPDDLPPGTYRVVMELFLDGVPTTSTWTAAHTFGFTIPPQALAMPPMDIGIDRPMGEPAWIPWRLFYNQPVLGTRGVGAFEDAGRFQVAPQIVTQGALYIAPPVDLGTGRPIDYRLEPFIPMIASTDRRLPTRPSLPLDLPGGELEVRVDTPDGSFFELGPAPLVQSFVRTPTTAGGYDLNGGTQQLDDVYSLTTLDDDFTVRFEQYGPHLITMRGSVEDLWGNRYDGGGTYEVMVAHPLDIDFGVLPGTPLAVGNAVNPTIQLHPPVRADVEITVTLLPDSDPDRAVVQTVTGAANRYGVFSPDGDPIIVDEAGEIRVDVFAFHGTPDGRLFAAAATWGGVVMTPPSETELVAHGRRGLDCLTYVPSSWFVSLTDLTLPGGVCHTFNPYFAGDVIWSRLEDGAAGGDSLLLAASFHDAVGATKPGYVDALDLAESVPRGDVYTQRLAAGELPLYTLTESGRIWRLFPDEVEYRAYAYGSSQRPGVRVREAVSEDGYLGLYWRLDTLYDDQPGVGIEGDQVNDFKFQYVGVVFHDVDTGFRQYLGQGTGWVFIPPDDPLGSRVMPPFAGPGNGGWTTRGGPLMTVKGDEVHLFAVLTGTHPGAILEVGQRFRLAGHLMPTLPSRVDVTLTAPDGTEHQLSTRANSVGYFYDPATDVVLDQPGVWTAELRAWHDGSCSGGQVVEPYPEGSVLGAEDGRFSVFVVPVESEPLEVVSPRAGRLEFGESLRPVSVRGSAAGATTARYTVTIPGWVLDEGEVDVDDGAFEVTYDPEALHAVFPNLDIVGRDEPGEGLSDTVLITLFAAGEGDGAPWYRAATVSLQGLQVAVNGRLLPETTRSGGGRRSP